MNLFDAVQCKYFYMLSREILWIMKVLWELHVHQRCKYSHMGEFLYTLFQYNVFFYPNVQHFCKLNIHYKIIAG